MSLSLEPLKVLILLTGYNLPLLYDPRLSTVSRMLHRVATLRVGVVSMAHGFGHPPDAKPDPRGAGGNTGLLASSETDCDRFSGIPRMSAIAVEIRPAPASV